MSKLEEPRTERRISFAGASSKAGEKQRGPSPAPSDSRRNASISKDRKSKGRKGSQSPKGSHSPKGSFAGKGSRRGSRRKSMISKDAKAAEEAAAEKGRSDSLFKKSDVRYKEIRRALTKRQRDAKKNKDSGEKPTMEL
jgi:hypothetical protein